MTCWVGLAGDKVSMPSFLNRLIHVSSHEENQYKYKLEMCQSHSPMAGTLHRVGSLANRGGLGSSTVHSFVSQHHPFPELCNVSLLPGASTAGMNLIQNSQCSAGCPHLFWTGYQGDFPDFCFLLCPSALSEWKCRASCPLLALFGSIPLSRLHLALMAVCVFGSPLSSQQLKNLLTTTGITWATLTDF